MPSFSFLPAEQDVYVGWGTNEPTLPQLRIIKLIVTELNDLTVTELYRLAKGRPEFHVGRFDYLRALELLRLLEESGLSSLLLDPGVPQSQD